MTESSSFSLMIFRRGEHRQTYGKEYYFQYCNTLFFLLFSNGGGGGICEYKLRISFKLFSKQNSGFFSLDVSQEVCNVHVATTADSTGAGVSQR